MRIVTPITLTNSQSAPTPAPFQQMIQAPITYPNGVRFWSPTDGWLYAWLESISNGVGTIWVKIPSSIPAGGTYQLYMIQDSTLPMDGVYWGEAPQLSSTYGQYDNGQYVFTLYSNFYDTLAGYSAHANAGNFVPTPTTSPYNGVELMNNSCDSGAYILSPNTITPGDYILQIYWSYNGSADGFSASIWGDPNTIYTGGGGNTPGMSGGLTYHYEFYTGGGGTPPDGTPNEASVFSLTGNYAGTLIMSAPASGEGTYYVYSQIAFYDIGSDSGKVAIYSSASTSASSPNSVTPAALYNSSYQSTGSFSGISLGISLSPSPILFGAGTGGACAYVYIYWALMRAYPPNGVMPSVTLGAPQYSGELITVTVPQVM